MSPIISTGFFISNKENLLFSQMINMEMTPCFLQLMVMSLSSCLNYNSYSGFLWLVWHRAFWRGQVCYYVKCFLISTQLMFPRDKIQVTHVGRNTTGERPCSSQCIIRNTRQSSFPLLMMLPWATWLRSYLL